MNAPMKNEPRSNERNVQALTQLLSELSTNGGAADTYVGPNEARHIAAYLAAQGVLAPSALTDEDAVTLYGWISREGLVIALKRIAKGERA